VPAVDFRLPSEDCRAYWTGVQTTTGLPRFAPVRYGRGGCFLYSGVHVSLHGTGGFPCHGRSVKLLLFDPESPCKPSIPATFFDEASSEVNLRSPVRPSPRPDRLDDSGSPWASPLCCRTLCYLALAGVGDKPGHWLGCGNEPHPLKLERHRVATCPLRTVHETLASYGSSLGQRTFSKHAVAPLALGPTWTLLRQSRLPK
jgi:hypothetical protein